MNNTVENEFFWISQGKVATVYTTGKVGKCTSYRVEFPQDLTRKIIKIGCYWKNKKVDVFWTQCIYEVLSVVSLWAVRGEG